MSSRHFYLGFASFSRKKPAEKRTQPLLKKKKTKQNTKTKTELIPCFLKQIIQWYEVVQTKLKVI